MNDSKSYFLYLLLCPISNDIRYVGITYQELEDRLKKHLCKKDKTHRGCWIKFLKNKKQKPQIKMLMENLDENQARSFEIWWGGFLWILGVDLTNDLSALGSIPPSQKGKKLSKQTKEKMSKSRTGKKRGAFSKSHREKISIAKKGKKRTEKEIENLKKGWTEERRKIFSIKNPSKIPEIHSRCYKSVSMFSLDDKWIMDFDSITLAVEYMKNMNISTNVGSISKVCKGKQKTAGKLKWKYKVK